MSDHQWKVAVFNTKPYDREFLERANEGMQLLWNFYEFRLNPSTAHAATGMRSVCAFVNDDIGAATLKELAQAGVKHIALRCAGFDNVDLASAKELGILVTRVPEYSPHAIAEHTLALLLTLNRKIHRAHNRVRELNFSIVGLTGMNLFGKTAGVFGAGKTGRLVAEIFRGFKMRVLAHDPFPDRDWAARNDVEFVSQEKLFRESDVLSLHAPLTPLTNHIINRESLALMKPGVLIVNTGRGRLVHTSALIDALKAGHVGGIAMDVYEREEGVFFEDLSGSVLQDDELARLLTFPNVLITAHQAFLTHEALAEIARITAENVRRVACGQLPLEGTVL